MRRGVTGVTGRREVAGENDGMRRHAAARSDGIGQMGDARRALQRLRERSIYPLVCDATRHGSLHLRTCALCSG